MLAGSTAITFSLTSSTWAMTLAKTSSTWDWLLRYIFGRVKTPTQVRIISVRALNQAPM